MRRVYVISDLHLGGGSDFRLCSQVGALTAFVEALSARTGETQPIELIVNGDFVDFLAEQRPAEDLAPGWTPFVANPREAAAMLRAIAARDRQLFRALTAFLKQGHRLVLLLGNHDLELALPLVRRTLVDELNVSGGDDFAFIYDGEAYAIGDALIEHGNQYDAWNRVNHGALRRLRSRQSRHPDGVAHARFTPPPGSRLVSEIINPIKAEYRFVDLLKPETDVVVPLLLALEPGYRRAAGRLAALCMARAAGSALSVMTGDISSTRSSGSHAVDLVATAGEYTSRSGGGPTHDPLHALLERLMPGESTRFLAAIDDGAAGDIAAGDFVNRTLGLMRLATASDRTRLEARLRALRRALSVLRQHRTFDRSAESAPEYLEAAQALTRRGFRFIVFGHTHLARDVDLGGGARYLNAGTWADVIQFPAEILGSGSEAEFGRFVADMRRGTVSDWVTFHPNYVRLDVNDDGLVAGAELVDYRPGDPV
jgi:UDP-2,3-diacylglucosamine pyrophosphatase LpxH